MITNLKAPAERATPANRIVRIGGASGAWGDSPMGVPQLLDSGVDYLMMDFLAEVTMSLLAKARLKDPAAGFPPDVIGYLKPHLATIAKQGVKVVTNGGGVNPLACKQALEAACQELGLTLRIAVVEGDDLMPMAAALREEGVREWMSDEPLPESLLTANAYLGALPIAAALAAGADIVITGRCVDSALALGILMHEFGWAGDDYDRLAVGSLVGHLLECGPQVTGGVFTDWESVPDWHNIGYPIAECEADGRFVLTKPDGTGGIVTPQTLAEQTLYEVGDPAAYILPDVVADFSQLRLEQIAPNRVAVTGVRGRAPTSQYKVSATWQDGYRAVALVCIVGVDAVRKAERTAEALLARGRMHLQARGLTDFSATFVEVLGGEANYGTQSQARASREVVLRVVVEHPDAKALQMLAREVGSIGLSFAQGTAALIGGRPKPTPVVRLHTFLVDKARLPAPRVSVGAEPAFEVAVPVAGTPIAAPGQPASASGDSGQAGAVPPVASEDWVEVPLLAVAHARSGDKGDFSNIAIICREPRFYSHLRQALTTGRIAEHFTEQVEGPVERFEAPGLNAFNFLMHRALGGGGMASRRIDAQGKAYGQRALEIRVRVPADWINH
ncbi:MAG: acyclic terpene utilization AtuA family protein [Pigmentiphaga sp.]|nr:acyclic terpene utilization AtuA family protein [Pigmentiphaga sp.]